MRLMHKLAVVATVAMFSSVALGQASYTSFPVLTANGVAVAGANIALCSSLPTATTPCGGSSVLQTYSDITLATACTLNPLILGPTYGVGCTNPGLADGFGMVRLYISSSSGSPAGYVYYQAYGQGILVTDVEPLMFPGTGTGGGIPGGSDTQIQFNKAGAFGAQSSLFYNYNLADLTNITSGTFNNTQQDSFIAAMGGANPATWYSAAYGGLQSSIDAVAGIMIVPSTSSSYQEDGLVGAVWNNAKSSTIPGSLNNGVGVYALCQVQVNGSACWGLNSATGDQPGISGTLTVGYEADFGLYGAPYRFQGIYLTGGAMTGTMPAAPAIGAVNGSASRASLLEAFFPPGDSFPAGLVWCRGCVNGPGIQLDGTAYSGASPSQSITLSAYDSGNTAHTATLQAASTTGILQLNGSPVCTAANGYCGGGGSIGGSGTGGTLPEFTGVGSSITLGNSPIVDGGSTGITVTVPSTGQFNANLGSGNAQFLLGPISDQSSYMGSLPYADATNAGSGYFETNGALATANAFGSAYSSGLALHGINSPNSGYEMFLLDDSSGNYIAGVPTGSVGHGQGLNLGIPSGAYIIFYQNSSNFASFNSTGITYASCSSGQYLKGDGTGCGSGLASPSFSAITSGTNDNTLLIGSGGSLSVTGTGTINANYLLGSALAALPGSLSNLCYTSSAWSWCPQGTGTVTVKSSGSLTNNALMTGGGTTVSQTPSATATLDSSGDMSLPGTLGVTGLTTLTGGASIPSSATVTVATGGTITYSGSGEINANYLLGGALPSLSVSAQCLEYTGSAWAFTTCGSGGGGVSTFSAGNLSPLFTTSVANPTSAPALSFSLSNASAYQLFGNPTNSSAPGEYFGVSSPLAFVSSALTCPTCDTSAASLTSNAVVIGGGGQATSTISAATTTTYALFATAGAPAFRAIASSDLPIIPNNLGGLGASFSSATGVVQVVSGTFSASTALANGTTATTQGIGDSTTKVATDQFVLQNAFTNPCTLLGCTIYGGSGGSATALNGPTGPNGVTEVYTSTPSGGAATAPQWSIPGVQLDEQSGTSYTIPATDNYHWVTSANASAVAWSGANMLVNNYAFHGANLLAGTVTYTPASGKVFPGNGSTGLTTQIIPQYWFFEATTDNTNTYMAVMPTISAFPNCNTAGSSALIFTSSTGVIGCNTISGGGSSAFSSITSGTNTTAAMLCGSGCTLGVTGSGTIAATSAPFSGLTPGINTSTTAWEIAPSTTVGGSTPTVYLLGAASETDTGALLKLNTGAASVQPALTVGTANNVQFSVCAQGSGIVVFGSVVPCTSIGTPATGNVIVEANGTNLQALREWAPNASYIGTMNRWNNATAPGTGYQFVQAYAGVTSTDTTNGGGTLVFEVLGNGSIDVGIWNGSVIGTQYGGLGGNFNASSGIPVFTSGSVSVTTTLPNGINIGAATASSLLVTGTLDGQVPVAITTGSTANLGSVYNSGYTFNQNTTAAQAITYTLPTPVPGKQYCVKNSTYGAAPDTGAITLIVANTGTQSLIYNGINSSSGYIVSAGQAGDGACAVAITTTQWEIYVQQGSWNLH